MANNPLDFIADTTALRSLVKDMKTHTYQFQGDLAASWHRMHGHIQSYPGNLSDHLYRIVQPHYERMCKSPDWQLSYANALNNTADAIDEADAEIAQWF